jgi:hypothetical protein
MLVLARAVNEELMTRIETKLHNTQQSDQLQGSAASSVPPSQVGNKQTHRQRSAAISPIN